MAHFECAQIVVREKRTMPETPLVRYAETTPLFTLNDLRERYGEASSDRSIRNVLYRLRRQGRLQIVCPGVYAGKLTPYPVDRYEIPHKLRSDAVVAYHSALEFHGVANQTFQTIYYQSSRARTDVVYEGVTYHRVSPPQRLIEASREGFQAESGPSGVRVTGRERSLVDCLFSLRYSGGADELDRCLAMFPSFDFELALAYLKLLKRSWLYAQLGYLLDRHADKLFFRGKWRDDFLRRVPRGVAYLGRKRKGYCWIATWSVMVPPSLKPMPEELERA